MNGIAVRPLLCALCGDDDPHVASRACYLCGQPVCLPHSLEDVGRGAERQNVCDVCYARRARSLTAAEKVETLRGMLERARTKSWARGGRTAVETELREAEDLWHTAEEEHPGYKRQLLTVINNHEQQAPELSIRK